MKINISIDYRSFWGQTVCVCGSVPELGGNDETKAVPLQCTSDSLWKLSLELKTKEKYIRYFYLIKEGERIVRKESGTTHFFKTDENKSFDIYDLWKDDSLQKFFYTSGFTGSFFFHPAQALIKYYDKTILIKVVCPFVKKGMSLILLGDGPELGEWKPENALHFLPCGDGIWQLPLNSARIKREQGYKIAIYSEKEGKIIRWEDGYNRTIRPIERGVRKFVKVLTIYFRAHSFDWKMAGVSLPVFSLKSRDSYGVGDFTDIRKLVDWAHRTGQKIIQLLPVNDTTITRTWTDSYPYSAISIYALHPLYLGLSEYPLEDPSKNQAYRSLAQTLNNLEQVDYEKVLSLKERYIKDLYSEKGTKVLASEAYKDFYLKNGNWLFSYACFCFLRDRNGTSDFGRWKEYRFYDEKKLKALVESSEEAKNAFDRTCFTQYLLDKQMKEAKNYAHARNVILKGDIPIGISRNSVEAWVEPDYFNMDVQAGAPPDEFSFYGQNWGFPTYNWKKMKKDGFIWWKKRFRKMSDYFDAYRIDHILGFFRIWEIPKTSVEGLLGYFDPALPFSEEEIRNYGFDFNENRMTSPFIMDDFLKDIFGEYKEEVVARFLQPIAPNAYALKKGNDNQVKIKDFFFGKEDEKSKKIRNGLYALCNEVLFIRDRKQKNKFHPRITAQYTYAYRYLSDRQKYTFNKIYDDYFYRRHNDFWKRQAMEKLPELISSTDMLVCGEDLGMVPDCVPVVMNDLQILSLEIERMPKIKDVEFEPLYKIPYLSVCTTSTHDMNPIREWWKENRTVTQRYYNQVLWKAGEAPAECTPEICKQILVNNLNSPAMLVIFPLQDWLSVDPALRAKDPSRERINVPAEANHYWRYRMHVFLESLIESEKYNDELVSLLKNSFRY